VRAIQIDGIEAANDLEIRGCRLKKSVDLPKHWGLPQSRAADVILSNSTLLFDGQFVLNDLIRCSRILSQCEMASV